MKLTQRRAFTLIELLVVIAIIAILAAILFPVFAQAKTAAKNSTDQSNVKQILLGAQMYLNDNDDIFHRLQAGPLTATAANVRWGPEEALAPYMKNQQIWSSPNDSFQRKFCGSLASPATKDPGFKLSYTFTFKGNDNNFPDRDTFGVHGVTNDTNVSAGDSLSQSALGAPADTIHMYPLFMTSSHSNNRAWWRYYSANLRSWPVYPQALSLDCQGTGDGRGAIGAVSGNPNWGFADGHVKNLPQASIMDPLWVTNPAQALTDRRKNLVHYRGEFTN